MTASSLTVTQQFGDRIAFTGPAGQFTYYHGGLPKACVHPLTTPAGRVLTGFEMSDHVWHRGLWFTIKFINGTNFWEENEPFGVQSHAREPAVEVSDETSARVRAELEWTSAATGPVIRETRSVKHHRIDADTAAIDWSCRLTAVQPLTLDRTPYTTWGGYGGLILRTSRQFHNAELLLPGGGPTKLVAGQTAEWILMNGRLDGGRDEKAAFAFVDHPSNPRSPSPWYARTGPEVNYINAAFLFAEPMELAAGRSLTFHYRVLLRDGHWTGEAFAPLASVFRATTPGPV